MNKGTRICKVCGKEYEYCKTNKVSDNIFIGKDVACCQEHAEIYFERVKKARAGEVSDSEENNMNKETKSSKRIKTSGRSVNSKTKNTTSEK